ncbi:hypothetical protein UFOVP29_297 [uncultured Caudovirales phage]|uniref:Putative tail fiber protein gp53-like C-terminal domain-containing protein n=1 Tax=uncultured Caudovirales phage TaxID=2100421 RepID=A0A6J5KLM8_9CAUD|nr:hypothetical protein UFOVP29_297 [uncultured Caudovirales phage]
MVTQINKYDGTVLVEIANNTLDTNYSLKLPGTGYKNYGSPVLDDMVWLMEHFSNTTAPVNPIKGQIWYDTTGGVLKLYNGAAWTTSGSIVSNSTAPAAPVTGTLWWDVTHQLLKTWNGSAWTAIGPVAQTVFWNGVQNNAPAADDTYTLGNAYSRFSTIYTTRQDTSGDSVVGGMLDVTGTATLGEVVAQGNVQVRGNLVAQNGMLIYNGLGVNGGVTINDTGLTVTGPATISQQVGIGKATDTFYYLDVNGPARAQTEVAVESSGPAYLLMKDNAAAGDYRLWGKSVGDDGTLSEYTANDANNISRYYLRVERNFVAIANVKIYTGNNDIALTVNNTQDVVVNSGNLVVASKNLVFPDNTSMSTAGSYNISSGWQKFPSGMIMQWGFVDFVSPQSEGLSGPYTFPIGFPNFCSSLSLTTVTPEQPGSLAAGDNQINIPYTKRPTSSQFWVWNNAISVEDSALGFYWQAIGY